MISMTSPTIQPGAVTAADLYAEVSAARREIGAMLTKIEVMDARHLNMSATVIDHEGRLRTREAAAVPNAAARLETVERWQARASAVCATLGVLAGVLSGWITSLIVHAH